ncbi:lysozyme inhibitor LprI family protein [Stappia sp.]|jgi:uncharacterized protein YecT (DUF1311 family)|uniref:lysozyme inhibitor LprI family protein n=1 Tax=Stappia sp. TaxID=1870903 RepID=UPI003A997887
MTRISFATLALAGLSLFVSLPASAAQPDVDCNDPQVQMEMTYCAEQEWQAADKDLNAAYGEAMKTMRGLDANQSADMKGAEKALKEAQHAWIAYRDKACAAYGYLAHGGTMEPMLIYQCNADLTTQRTEELEQLAAGLGN